MNLTELTAISPIDGRYRNKVSDLDQFFSEYALIRYRVKVEVEYFIALTNAGLPQLDRLTNEKERQLRSIYEDLDEKDAQDIKDTEQVINHDVKAVEYFVKQSVANFGLPDQKEFVHFGLTSQDINNTAIPMAFRDFLENTYLPAIHQLRDQLNERAEQWAGYPMLARTHGQPASPTAVGKEIRVFSERLTRQIEHLEKLDMSGKFGGATGNLNAHYVAFPEHDWVNFANAFLHNHLHLHRQQTTTQIEHYDDMAAHFDAMRRINVILTDLAQDLWTYISMDYFGQKINEQEVGSSAMPHKVNPIDFENAEGNLGLANALFGHLSGKLPISRLQRDLTDSTVTRNIGVPCAHTMLALKSLGKGLGKLTLNTAVLNRDLEANWMVVAEAIQTILRREGYEQPYEALKTLTRQAAKVDKEAIHHFIDQLEVSDAVKQELKAITPQNYLGHAGR